MTSPGKVWLIGAGPGDLELLTLKAVRALGEARIWLIDDLVNPDIAQFALPDTRIIGVGKRGGCRSTPQSFINRLMARYARQGQVVARIKGGDAMLFGRGGEEVAYLQARGIAVDVVNGLTALHDAVLRASTVPDDRLSTYLEQIRWEVGSGARVGPYAFLPTGSSVGSGAVTGAFYTAPGE